MTMRVEAQGPTVLQGLTDYAVGLVTTAAVVQVGIGAATSTIYPALAQPGTTAFEVSGLVLTVTHLMVLAGFVGLAYTPAAGSGWLKRVAVAVTLIGLGANTLGEGVLRVNFDLGNTLFGIGTPACALGLTLLGIAIIRARHWTGWHRYTVLATGLYIPIVLIPAFVLAKGPSFPALAGWAALFIATGVAMRAEYANDNG